MQTFSLITKHGCDIYKKKYLILYLLLNLLQKYILSWKFIYKKKKKYEYEYF